MATSISNIRVKRILGLYNDPPKDGVVVSLDEKGTITVKDYGGSSWREDVPRIPDRQKMRGRTELTAAYLPHSGRVFYRFSDKKRTYHVTGLLRQVRASVPKPVKLYVILDNHRMHTGSLLKRFVEEDKFVELVFTPKNASWWNAIEQVFADVQKKVLNNSSFEDVGVMKSAVRRRLSGLNVRLKELLAAKGGRYAFAFDLWKRMTTRSSYYRRHLLPALCPEDDGSPIFSPHLGQTTPSRILFSHPPCISIPMGTSSFPSGFAYSLLKVGLSESCRTSSPQLGHRRVSSLPRFLPRMA